MQPTFVHLDDGHTGLLLQASYNTTTRSMPVHSPLPTTPSSRQALTCMLHVSAIFVQIRKKVRRSTGEGEAQQLKAASGTDAKVLAGAVSS